MKKVMMSLLLVAAIFQTKAQALKEVSGGLQSPESIVAYKEYLFVSNMGEKNTPHDGDGYISAHARFDGKLLVAKYFTGLNSPKGLKVIHGCLIVADGDRVVAFNLKTKKQEWVADFSKLGVVDINDITKAGCHSIYVSSTDKNAIYKVCKKGAVITQLAVKGDIEGANGLYRGCHKLYLANFGHTGQANGSFGTMGLCNKKYKAIQTGGIYDGIQKIGNHIVVTDWVSRTENKGRILVYRPCKKKVNEVALGRTIGGPSDIYVDWANKTLWVPAMLENKLIGIPFTSVK